MRITNILINLYIGYDPYYHNYYNSPPLVDSLPERPKSEVAFDPNTDKIKQLQQENEILNKKLLEGDEEEDEQEEPVVRPQKDILVSFNEFLEYLK